MVEMKTCTLCGETKPFEEFVKHRQMKDGLSYWCKECTREKARTYRETPAGVYTGLKQRINFWHTKPLIISKEDFIEWYEVQERVCVYCDISEGKLLLLDDAINNTTNKLTIECMENSIGYIGGNLALACRRCNLVKSDLFTFDEMREIAQRFIKPKWVARLKESTTKRDENGI